mmetsp:Transcript_28684/g.41696  ORF Transcript_28684/g.41696 Transcript_28684/m.41696 type:complete len:107 (-) Transcript_28684:3048-3368(-)
MEVQMYGLSNEFLYKEFCIDPIKNIMASRQLRWLGKIALMEETRLPRKCIGAWHANPCDSLVFLVIRLSKYVLEGRRPGKQGRGVMRVQVGQARSLVTMMRTCTHQ